MTYLPGMLGSLPRSGKVLVPFTEVNVQCPSNANDGFIGVGGKNIGTYFQTPFESGCYLDGTAVLAVVRFTGIAIPVGAVITSAILRTNRTAINGTGGGGSWVGQAHDNAPAWANNTAQGSHSITSASASVNTGSGTQDVDITAIIQEIVSRPGWASGNAIRLRTNGAATSGNNRTTWQDTTASPNANRARLIVNGVS